MPSLEEIRERLRTDGAFYAPHCLKISNEDGHLVALNPKRGQLKIEAAIQAQQQANKPVRIVVLKARRLGSSTWALATLMRYLTQTENRRGLVVAQDRGTGAELFDIARRMYSHLPDEHDLKPPLYQDRDSQDQKFLWFGERSKFERNRGNLGLNSMLSVDTAKELDAGRGKTISALLATEVAHWPDPRKALALLNAVFDRPNTIVILESTANGFDPFFKARWDRATKGEGGYTPVFIGWHEDENCQKPFDSEEDRERFIEEIGYGEWGEDEPELVERYGCTPEQLNWRRYAIVDKVQGKLELFRQEYPSNPTEAFVGSGRHVFSVVFVQRAIARCEDIAQLSAEKGGPQEGIFKETSTRTRRIHDGSIEVPEGGMWVPSDVTGFPHGHDFWTRWELPLEEDEQPTKDPHIVVVDPASGEGNTTGEEDFHAIQVLNHRTKEQVARLRTRQLDPDEVALQALLAALYYHDAMISVEVTGGYGVPIVRKLWDAYGWRRMFKRKAVEAAGDETTNRLGWDTNRRTKPLMIAGFHEMLREGTHGLRDLSTALELRTYITDNKGRQRADASAFDDQIMAYMQAQEVARETRLPISVGGTKGPVSTWTRPIKNRKAGW